MSSKKALMNHQINITSVALVVSAALLSGLGFGRFGLSPVLGYILSGIILGPSCLSVIGSRDQVDGLAELGILLLLFIVGMELNLRTFKKVWLKATIYSVTQIVLSLSAMAFLSPWLGGSKSFALLLGFVIALSSTAIVVKMMEGIGELKTDLGQLTIGILICQDLAIVPMILILKNQDHAWTNVSLISKVLLSIVLIVLLIRYLSRKERIHIPLSHMVIGDRELTPLASLTFCFGAAALTGLVGLSAPYGSFLAGLILGNARERLVMIETTKPIQNVLMMIFFLSIGLLLDFGFVWKNIGILASLLAFVTIIKTVFNVLTLKFLKLTWSQAFLSGVLLAQLGEFSFLMATVAYDTHLVTDTEKHLIMSVTVLSLSLSPFWLISSKRLKVLAEQIHKFLRGSVSGVFKKKR